MADRYPASQQPLPPGPFTSPAGPQILAQPYTGGPQPPPLNPPGTQPGHWTHTRAIPPGLFISPGNPGVGPPPPQQAAQPPALTPPHRLAAPQPYVIGVSAAGVTTSPVQIPVTTPAGEGDLILVLSGMRTINTGAPVITGVSDTQGNPYLPQPGYSPGTKTLTGPGADIHSGACSAVLGLSDVISAAWAGSPSGISAVAIGIPGAAQAGIDQQAPASTASSATSLSATTPATRWPGEQAVALLVNSSNAGAPTSLGGFTQLAQVHSAGTLFLTVASLPVPLAQAVTASMTLGSAGAMTVLAVTVPGLAAADPSAFDFSSLAPPGMFASPGGQPHLLVPQQPAQPQPLIASAGSWDPSLAMPPGLFVSPGNPGLPPPPPQQAAQPPPLPPGSGSFPVAGPGPAPGLFISPASLPFVPPVPQQAPPPPGRALVQAVAGGSVNDYGLSSVQIATTAGNFLAVFAGWDLHNGLTAAPVPVVYPSDSTGTNIWYHLGTSPASGYGSRSAIWVCPNARAVSWVSCSLTAFASSLAYLVCEFTGMPALFDPDLSVTGFANLGIPTVQKFTSGSGTWRAPAGITSVLAECWGGGGPGARGVANGNGGGGGGGGEYAAELALAVTPQHFYPYSTGAAGTTGPGGASTFAGDVATVTAHGGQAATSSAGGTGGTGSANAVHFPGGSGGNPAGRAQGMGGGASGSAAGPGASVPDGSRYGASAPPGGGPGGTGGLSESADLDGSPPPAGPGGGGGGGGQDDTTLGRPASGAPGQVQVTYATSPRTLALSGTPGGVDVAFAVLAAGSATVSVTSPPPGLALAGAASAGSGPDPVQIWAYWNPSVPGGTALTPSWTVSAATPLSGVLAAIASAPPVPVQPNPSFPVLRVEAAFGAVPGDPSATPPSWTDITARCIGKEGSPFISPSSGREYELTAPEAGELLISANNVDGAFTPGNPASPYYPGVVVATPVRVSAYWQGSWYPVFSGYVERWPQEWPDMPQWGMSAMVVTDSIAVLASATMPSALQGDILLDAPVVFLPLAEQYLSSSNGLNPATGALTSFSQTEAAGLIAANLSRSNQQAGVYADGMLSGAPLPVATGQAMNLLGDQGTGAGVSSVSGNVAYNATPVTGPGVIYASPSLPSPASATGVSVEAWLVANPPNVAGQGVTLLQAFSPPSSYWPPDPSGPGSGPVSFSVSLTSAPSQVLVLFNGTPVTFPVPSSATAQQVVVAFASQPAPVASVYLNGTHLGDVTLTAGMTTPWTAITAGPCGWAYSAFPYVHNFTLASLTVYPCYLPAARVASHWATGAAGAAGASVSQGAARVLSWAGLGIPRGGPVSFSGTSDGIALGPFYALAGGSAGDGLNGCVTSDGGMVFASATGVLTVLPRWALFGLSPQVTFGDATDGSETPYLPGQAFDYDNTYLYSAESVTRQNGPATSITATTTSQPSQLAYFARAPRTLTISTTSDLDAYTASQWDVARYAQPRMRVRSLVVDASAAQAFTAVLGTGQGAVVTANRRPAGGAAIGGQFIVQKVSHKIGPATWRTEYQISPYVLESQVLQLDTGQNTLGGAVLG